MSEGTADGSIFEGLARALKPEGAFADELRSIGFDVRDIQLRYPSGVLAAVLDVAHRHVYPDLGREQAHRRIGQRMVDSFFETIFGKVVRTLLQVLGPERFLVRMPKIAPMGTTGLQIRVERPAPGEVRLFFRSQHLVPAFIAGAVETVARGATVEIAPGANEQGFELYVTGLR